MRDHPSLPPPPVLAEPGNPAHDPDMAPKVRRTLHALGDRVMKLRLAKGWTRTTLARRARVTVTTIRGCEEGSKVTQPEKLKAIAVALGVTPRRLEVDEKDPRVRFWTDEDYEIGNWYHNAPRPLKNRIWALQEVPAVGHALLDPQLGPLLDGWSTLSQDQKNLILNAFDWSLKKATHKAEEAGGATHAIPPTDRKVREPVR